MCKIKNKKYKSPNVLYNLVDGLTPLFSKYDYFDLCRAIFAMNSFRSNRSELKFYLTLNETLRFCNRDGEIKIETYDQFYFFFNEIKKYYKFSCYVDKTVPDFGDVFIHYNGKLYPILLGTGYNNVYSLMETLYPSMQIVDKVDEMEKILLYLKKMINALRDNNVYDKDNCYGDFYLPSSSYFYSVKKYYTKINEIPYLLNKDGIIDSIHFIDYNDEFLPIFNSSIIIDAYNNALKYIVEEKKQIFSSFILNSVAINNFCGEKSYEKLITHVGVIEDLTSKKIFEEQICSTILFGNDRLLLLISEDDYNGNSLKKYIKKINILHKSDKLQFANFDSEKVGILQVNKEADITIVAYSFQPFLKKYQKKLKEKITQRHPFLDLIYYLCNAKRVDEIIDFIKFTNKNKSYVQRFENFSGVFDMWINSNKTIEQGALTFGSLLLDVYHSDFAIFEKFLDLKGYYPFDWPVDMFEYPTSWVINGVENGYKHIYSKAFDGYMGFIRTINGRTFFYSENLKIYKITEPQIELNHFKFISDIILEYIKVYENDLIKIGLFDYNVMTLVLQLDYAKSVDRTGFTRTKNKYVYSDAMKPNDYTVIIRFAVNIQTFMNDLKDAATRKIECQFLKEFFSCLLNIGFELTDLYKKLEDDENELKIFNSKGIIIEYYLSGKNIRQWPNLETFVNVRKKIAKICYEQNVTPGTYSKEETKQIVRKIQKPLVNYFEELVSQYDKTQLHCILLSYLAFFIHEKRVGIERYDFSNDQSLSLESRQNNAKIIVSKREEHKRYIKNILYLIETNLYVEHLDKTIELTQDNIDYLLAYSTWLVTLQDVSDMAHWKLSESSIKISYDYVLDTFLTDLEAEQQVEKNHRIYKNKEYIPKIPNKDDYFLEILKGFYIDTTYKYDWVISLAYSLSTQISEDFLKYEYLPDVIKIDVNKFKELFFKLFNEEIEASDINNMEKSLKFLICDTNALKTIDNNEHEILPIWEREKRNNRFDVKPLVILENEIIFSPIILYDWMKAFESGIFSMYPMYEIGLNNTCNAINNYSNACQKKMETEIADLFDKRKYIVFKELDFYKTISKDFPQELGGYDVIAIDVEGRTIWNLESKFIHKVGSIYEYANQQKGFFLQNKYDEKFQRRIDFLMNNYKILLEFKNLPKDDFIIKNYMVTNKVLECDVKIISFEIITFNELKEIVNN